MSMLPLIAGMVIVGAEVSEAPLDQLVQRWDAECQTTSETPECASLAAEIELGLYDVLRKLAMNRLPIDRDVLRAAAESDLPVLARFGVSMLGEPQNAAETEALLRAVNHPVLAVRYIAARNLGNSKDPRWLAIQPWWTGWTLASSAHGPEESLVPDPRPQPDQFSMTSFKYMDYQYYGSDREKAMFTTAESAESFVKRLSSNRRVVSSLDAMQEQMDRLQPELEAVQKEIEAAGAKNDMEALTRAMKKYEEIGKRMSGATIGATSAGMVESHTVILREDKSGRPTTTVVVQRDDRLNRTILVFWREGGWRS